LEAITLLGRVNTGSLMKMMVLGRHGPIDAEEARRINLVDEVVPHAQLRDRALELAALIGKNSPAAIEVSKRALFDATRGPYADSFWRGWDRLKQHWGHPDILEGARAFAEKRAPNWYVGEEDS
jgi:enoyl-CoA hydratase/carnithine racemase